MIAAALANMKHGGDRRSDQAVNSRLEISQAQAAEKLGVGTTAVEDAATVQRKGVPELAEAVRKGEASVSAAAKGELPDATRLRGALCVARCGT
jgi:hypothetical protein